jgi:hypothetical protein
MDNFVTLVVRYFNKPKNYMTNFCQDVKIKKENRHLQNLLVLRLTISKLVKK